MYKCSECNRPVGLMADADGNPVPYKCPRTGRVAQPQHPVKRTTPPLPKEPDTQMTQILREARLTITAKRWLSGDS